MNEKKLYLECGCADACAIMRLEYFEDFDEIYLQVHPKWKHKYHGIIISRDKAQELINYLNEFLDHKKEDKNEKIL